VPFLGPGVGLCAHGSPHQRTVTQEVVNVPIRSLTEGRNDIMRTPGHIVVCVDGSPSSRDSLRSAVGQVALTGEGVHAVNAWQYPTLSAWTR
jgi:hypothetical protein